MASKKIDDEFSDIESPVERFRKRHPDKWKEIQRKYRHSKKGREARRRDNQRQQERRKKLKEQNDGNH